MKENVYFIQFFLYKRIKRYLVLTYREEFLYTR